MTTEQQLSALLDLGEITAFAAGGTRQAIRWAGAKTGRRFDWFVTFPGGIQGLTADGVSEFYANALDLRA